MNVNSLREGDPMTIEEDDRVRELLTEASTILAKRTVEEIESMAAPVEEGRDHLETDIVCSMLYAAREAVYHRGPR